MKTLLFYTIAITTILLTGCESMPTTGSAPASGVSFANQGLVKATLVNMEAPIDSSDETQAQKALNEGKTGLPSKWQNSNTNVDYEVLIIAKQKHGGTTCKKYAISANTFDWQEKEYGLACPVGGGKWRKVKE